MAQAAVAVAEVVHPAVIVGVVQIRSAEVEEVAVPV